MAEAAAHVRLVIQAHGDHEMRVAQDRFGERAALVPAYVVALLEQVVAHVGAHDVGEVDRAGRRHVDPGTLAERVAQRVLGGQAPEDVSGANEKYAPHATRITRPMSAPAR